MARTIFGTKHKFIYKVIVHEKHKIDGHRTQAVEIIYNCVGAIELPDS